MVLAPPPAAESEILEISNILLGAALQDRTACHVTAALSELLDEPVFLLTRDFHTWAKALPRDPSDPFIASTDALGGVPREVVAEWQAAGDVAGLWVADRAVVMPAAPIHPRLVLCSIRASGEPGGSVMIPPNDSARDDVMLASAQHLAVVAGLNLLRLRAFNAVEEQSRSSLVYALIDGSFTSQHELLERATIAGFRHELPHAA